MAGPETPSKLPWPSLWPALPPVLPLLGAVAILEFLAPGGTPEDFAKPLLGGSGLAARHLGGRLGYAAVAFFHAAVCAGAIGFFWEQIREEAGRGRVLAAVLAGAVLILGAIAGLSGSGLAAYDLSYFNIAELVRGAKAGEGLLALAPPFGVTKLALMSFVPIAFGVAAALMASGAACLAAWERPGGPSPGLREPPEPFRDRIQALQQGFFILSAVLVTSTLTASLFYHLPAEMFAFPAEAPQQKEALLDYARGLSLFWGAVYTLTLLAVFVPPALILRGRMRAFAREKYGKRTLAEFRAWLAEHKLAFSLKENLKNVLALLAPLAAGPVGSLLQNLAG